MLGTLTIELPPLKQRREDIPALCQYYVEQFNGRGGRQLSGFSKEALDELVDYPWPGNIEELQRVVTESCGQAKGPWIEPGDLPDALRWAAQEDAHPRRQLQTIDMDAFLEDIENELIRRAMQQVKGNKSQAARLLGITRARLHRRWEQLQKD